MKTVVLTFDLPCRVYVDMEVDDDFDIDEYEGLDGLIEEAMSIAFENVSLDYLNSGDVTFYLDENNLDFTNIEED